MHYHTSEKGFYVVGYLSPEPKELLEQLEAMYAAACAQFCSLPKEVSDEDFDEDDEEGLGEGMARLTYAAISMHWSGR